MRKHCRRSIRYPSGPWVFHRRLSLTRIDRTIQNNQKYNYHLLKKNLNMERRTKSSEHPSSCDILRKAYTPRKLRHSAAGGSDEMGIAGHSLQCPRQGGRLYLLPWATGGVGSASSSTSRPASASGTYMYIIYKHTI